MPCSEASLAAGLPLIGSAGFHDTILAFELAPPWSARLVGSRAGDAGLDAAITRIAADAKSVRLLALEPASTGGESRVLCFRRGEWPFREHRRREFLVPRGSLACTLEELAFEGECGASSATRDAGATRDLLVCTHGTRDACCGRLGYPLYRELAALAAARPRGEAAPSVRVWRCSHLGGHRFAPTLLDLPNGRLFGRVSIEDARRILDGGEDLAARVATVYRGRTVLPEAAQVVERALWMRLGAAFETAAVRADVRRDEGGFHVVMRADLEDGRVFEARGEVALDEDGALLTPASCGRDPEPDTPWRLVAWELDEKKVVFS